MATDPEVAITSILLVFLLIVLIFFRVFLAKLVYEKQTTNVFTTKSEWKPSVIIVPGSQCKMNAPFPLLTAGCMLEGATQYTQQYKRECDEKTCINFEGTQVMGLDTFTGMCSNTFCQMSQVSISFDSTGSYMSVTPPSTLTLAGSNNKFYMRRLNFNDKGQLVPDMRGILATFVYYDPSTNIQYLLNYNNRTPYRASGSSTTSFITQLQLTASPSFIFPSGLSDGITLFILMEEISPKMVGINIPSTPASDMQRKILVFSSPRFIVDSDLENPDTFAILQNFGSKDPSVVYNKGIVPLGCGIITYQPSQTPQGFYTAGDYEQELNNPDSSILRSIIQNIDETRLRLTDLKFYNWFT